MIRRLKKARRYFLDGKADYEAGSILKAVSTLALATTYDPKNEEYRSYQQVPWEAQDPVETVRRRRRSAEGFANWRRAQANWRRPSSTGRITRLPPRVPKRNDDDRRTALRLRQAVTLSPDTIEFRMGLAELFGELGLKVNARAVREDPHPPEGSSGGQGRTEGTALTDRGTGTRGAGLDGSRQTEVRATMTIANTVVVGLQWGDEGKGKVVDRLAAHSALVVGSRATTQGTPSW